MTAVATKKFTASNLNSFFKCPFKWKLLKIDKVSGIYVENEKRDLAENVHRIIAEYYHLIGSSPTEKQIETVAKDCFKAYFEPIFNAYHSVAEDMIQNFVKFEKERLKNYRKPIFVEKTLEDNYFKGIIDYFDGVNIIDWKTGSVMGIDDDLRRQGKIYEILLNHNGFDDNGKYKTYKIYFVTLKNERVLELPFTPEAWLMNQTTQMYSIVNSGKFPKHRSPLCNWCEAQLTCEFEDTTLWSGVDFY